MAGDRRSLARAITLVESTREDHRQQAVALLQQIAPATGKSIRVGISGVPGVGKSTFIEAIGNHLLEQGHRLAVLAVDPSSAISGGSILGDKTRMEKLATRQEAFIRPSPAGTSLGGVARRTRETLLLCESAGFDVIFVETVGVGQSETMVADMTDLFLLLMLPGAGDELQGIKRGIMELADIVLINKADGEMAAAAQHAGSDFRYALHLLHPRTRGWQVPVKTCSSITGEGIEEAWREIKHFMDTIQQSGELVSRRANQAREWMWSETSDSLLSALRNDQRVRQLIPELEQAVTRGSLPPGNAAARLLAAFLGNNS
ncbi:MAG: methylmalonyl Co-A mutase-associated GTPase MeaB [Gammaproteobacteria bacterium]|nr:methylmalonyl Co-A mutase-associated GTPase MeaB [Gammaproteobacteria bacterium]